MATRFEIKGLSTIRSSVLSLKLFLLFLLWLGTAFFATSTVIGKAPAHNGIEIDTRERPRVRAYRLATPPTLDGLVNEPFWAQMESATNFIQQQPNEGLPATEQTEVRIGFDDDNLYFGIICFDSQPENIVVTQNRRDASLTDTDSIEIQLDTFNDKQNAVIFGTSPTGIEFDGQVSKAGQGRSGVGSPARAGGTGGGGAQRGGSAAFNLNWDAVWWVRAQITPRGWEAEIKIPLRSLRYHPGPNQVWGLNLRRNLRRRNEQSFWSPMSRAFEFNYQIELAGSLEGLDLESHHNLRLQPYVLGGFKRDYMLAENPTRAQHTGGLDVKYNLTSSLTMDATFNTDFAQVEVDEEQINLTRFDLFFPEKRPFFLENSGTFEFGSPREVEIFFSRRIGIDETGEQIPIDAGVRLTGKAGKYDLGLLNMQTRKVKGVAPANNFGVFRLSREFGTRSSLGIIGVSRQSTSSRLGLDRLPFNRTFGADVNFGFGKYANFFNYFAKSITPGRNSSNQAGSTLFGYDDPHHRIDLSYLEVGRNFNPEVGFVNRVGFRKPSFGYRRTFTPEGKRLRAIFPHFQWNRWYTIAAARQPHGKESGFEHYHLDTRWQNGSTLGIAWNRNFERLDKPFEVYPGINIQPGAYHYSEMVANFGSDPSANLFASGNVAVGNFYAGTIRTINVNGGYRIGGYRYTLTASYIRNFIHLPEGNFNTDLLGYRFNWSFTPKSYFQSFIQYNSRTQDVGINARLGLLSTSSTGLFIVYNSRVATVDFLDPHEVERRTLSRALFIKFNYLFDF